ncbi:MAG: cupin domain-containing protein [Spirochaetes bacterium]|nr:cupin domain-containing protein [Spirochaetota bacterium]
MKKLRLKDLHDINDNHIFKDLLPGKFIYKGGLSFGKPGSRSHSNDGPNGKDYHIHQDHELFLVVQGKGKLELDKNSIDIITGDIIVIEPEEDHHLISDMEDPLIVLYCHASDEKL